MNFKKATIEDLAVLTIMLDDFRQCYEQSSNIEACNVFLKERISKDDSFFIVLYVLEQGLKVNVGFVSIYPSFSSISLKKILYLSDLYVCPEYRKNGYAKELISYAKQFAKETDSGQLVIESRISNSSAQRLYDSVGFTKEGEHLYYYLEE